MKALVVESSSTMRSVLRRILLMRSFEVSEAGDGRQALETLSSIGATDLVLVSWIPNERVGVDFITRLRRNAAYESVIILMATGEPRVRDLQRAFMAGANDYLMKPFTSMQMDEKLARFGLR